MLVGKGTRRHLCALTQAAEGVSCLINHRKECALVLRRRTHIDNLIGGRTRVISLKQEVALVKMVK